MYHTHITYNVHTVQPTIFLGNRFHSPLGGTIDVAWEGGFISADMVIIMIIFDIFYKLISS